MKKILFSFAIVAAGLLMTSCGGNDKKTEEGQKAENTEVTTDEAQPAEGAEAAGAEFETKSMKMMIPAGLKNNDNVSSKDDNVIHLDAPSYGEFESIHIHLNTEAESPEAMVDKYYNGNEASWKKADDLNIGAYTFKRLDAVDNADVNCQLFAQALGGVLEVEVSKNVPADAPELAEAIKNIEIKE